MGKTIAFGTSGWRGIIGDSFTFPRVRVAAKAVSDHIKDSGRAGDGICVGHDTRFLSEHFAAEAARVVRGEGIDVLLSRGHVPTPILSHAIRARGLAGAINITASHNPSIWSGFKVNNHRGAPAPAEVTRDLEARAEALLRDPGEAWFAREKVMPRNRGSAEAAGSGVDPDLFEPYLESLGKLIRFDAIRDAGITVGVDPLWGAASAYLPETLRRHRIPVAVLHDERDVRFGGLGPDPVEKNLGELRALVSGGGARIGIANDGDADRFGIVDADGTVVPANTILALLADYLAESRGWRQGLARTYATTRLIDAVAAHHGCPLHQTPVGFKYLGELILEEKAFLAGEESAGMSILGHVPEKDGLVAGLLAAEMVAATGRTLGQLKEDLFEKVGAWYSAREDTPVNPDQVARLRERMESPPERVGSRKIAMVTVWDGIRLDFEDGAWLLMRPSGTEPVVRYYVEARTPAELRSLVDDGRTALLGGKS